MLLAILNDSVVLSIIGAVLVGSVQAIFFLALYIWKKREKESQQFKLLQLSKNETFEKYNADAMARSEKINAVLDGLIEKDKVLFDVCEKMSDKINDTREDVSEIKGRIGEKK